MSYRPGRRRGPVGEWLHAHRYKAGALGAGAMVAIYFGMQPPAENSFAQDLPGSVNPEANYSAPPDNDTAAKGKRSSRDRMANLTADADVVLDCSRPENAPKVVRSETAIQVGFIATSGTRAVPLGAITVGPSFKGVEIRVVDENLKSGVIANYSDLDGTSFRLTDSKSKDTWNIINASTHGSGVAFNPVLKCSNG